MNRTRPIRLGLTAAIAACSVATACATTSAAVSTTAATPTLTTVSTATVSTTTVSTTTVSTANVSHRNARGGGGTKLAPRLPVDFPAAVRLYPGVLQGSTGRAPRWSVLIFVRAGAARVQRSAIAFYVARGYHADSRAVVHNARFRLTMIAANRDHSATQTNLTIAVAKR